MSHKPEDDDSRKEEKIQRYGKNKRTKNNDSAPPPTLRLSEKIKATLANKWKMKPIDIENVFNDTSLN